MKNANVIYSFVYQHHFFNLFPSYYTHNKTRFRKAVYREYTDATFSQQKEPKEEHGILGPVLKIDTSRGQDYVIVHFKNLASRPYSIHVHGGLYHEHYEYAYKHDYISKASEGTRKSIPTISLHYISNG